MTQSSEAIAESLVASLRSGQKFDSPYQHYLLEDCLPEGTVGEIAALPFEAPELGGVSGKRELHNQTRVYFDAENRERFEVCNNVAAAFQSAAVTGFYDNELGIDLSGSYVRIEYAQDTGGFWLEPHTDLGVKLFTLLLYVSDDPAHADLGTDIYDTEKRHVARSPFAPNHALLFVPSDITYHGFEPRTVEGVRKSIIVNYVTDEWRAREQLSFPESPVQAA